MCLIKLKYILLFDPERSKKSTDLNVLVLIYNDAFFSELYGSRNAPILVYLKS